MVLHASVMLFLKDIYCQIRFIENKHREITRMMVAGWNGCNQNAMV